MRTPSQNACSPCQQLAVQEQEQLQVLLQRGDERRHELLAQAMREREELGVQERQAVQELQSKVRGVTV